jgi:hypothetical protein
VIDNTNNDEAAGDNNTIFSEVQLSGDVDESTAQRTTLDTDFRLSRLRRSTIIDRRMSSVLSTRSQSFVSIEKVIKIISDKFISIVFFSKKKFPGMADKRDRLLLIDYDQLLITDNDPKLSLTNGLFRRSRSMV